MRYLDSSEVHLYGNYAKVSEKQRERERRKCTWSGDEEEDVRVETDLRREVLPREDTEARRRRRSAGVLIGTPLILTQSWRLFPFPHRRR